MKKLLNSIYSVYVFGSYFFCLSLFLIAGILTAWLPTRSRFLFIYRFAHIVTNIWGFFTGVRLRREQVEKLDPQQTYVMVANHVNMLDIIMAGTLVIHPMYTLIKKEFFKVPVLGLVARMLTIPVDRSSPSSKKKSMDLMLQKLKAGFSVLVFPEGTRNRSGDTLMRFHDGAFSVAIASQLPILPIVLLNSRDLQPVNTFRAYPGTASLRFLDPIPTQGLQPKDLPALKQQVWDRMSQEITPLSQSV